MSVGRPSRSKVTLAPPFQEFSEIDGQVDRQGLVLRRDTILNAPLVRATRNPPREPGIAPEDVHPDDPVPTGRVRMARQCAAVASPSLSMRVRVSSASRFHFGQGPGRGTCRRAHQRRRTRGLCRSRLRGPGPPQGLDSGWITHRRHRPLRTAQYPVRPLARPSLASITASPIPPTPSAEGSSKGRGEEVMLLAQRRGRRVLTKPCCAATAWLVDVG